MFEFLICSSVTILPDYLIRRHVQGKRIGHEITLFSMWYELRYGITLCAILTISLITVIFYYHPASSNITSFFRTVTILPDVNGRVTEVYVRNNQDVKAGDPLFRFDDRVQRAAVDAARSQVAEIDAALSVGQSELAAAQGQVDQALGGLEQAQEEYDTRKTLLDRGSNAVSTRDVEKAQNVVDQRVGAVDAARSNRAAVEAKLTTLLPAQRATAEAALAKAQTDLDRTVVYAGTDGRIQQFALQVGDIVNPFLRAAGVLVPDTVRAAGFQAGFDQISAQVIVPGMIGEITCVSNPFVIIPMVVTGKQDVIAAGQFQPSDRLLDIQERAAPGTVTVYMEPLYPEQIAAVPPGSKCIGNLYTSNHDRLAEAGDLSTLQFIALHTVDTVGAVHALLLRIQALLLPVQTLVLSGHH